MGWAAIAIVAMVLLGAGLWSRWRPDTGPPIAVPAHPSAAFAMPALPADETSARIATLLHSDAAFARDVTFLVAASIRERCSPEHAGELAKMANRARLPVLAATSEVTAREPVLDQPIYRAIQFLANAAPCGRVLDMTASGLQLQFDPQRYAQAFPDSYFAPSMEAVPREHAGRPLAVRAAQACQSIAYAVLPLGRPAWQCTSLWSTTRTRIVSACEAERDSAGERGDEEISAQVSARLTPKVAAMLETLPASCR